MNANDFLSCSSPVRNRTDAYLALQPRRRAGNSLPPKEIHRERPSEPGQPEPEPESHPGPEPGPEPGPAGAGPKPGPAHHQPGPGWQPAGSAGPAAGQAEPGPGPQPAVTRCSSPRSNTPRLVAGAFPYELGDERKDRGLPVARGGSRRRARPHGIDPA